MESRIIANKVEGQTTTHQRRPAVEGTLLLCAALGSAAAIPFSGSYEQQLRIIACIVGGGLAISLLFEVKLGWQNLMRVDVAALCGLYVLGFFEFLFPQEFYDRDFGSPETPDAIKYFLIGMGAFALGRHFLGSAVPSSRQSIFRDHLTIPQWLLLFWLCFFIGNAAMFWSVRLNLWQMFNEMVAPRFSQSWGRERLGGAYALFYELNVLTYGVPAVFGALLGYLPRNRWGVLILPAIATAFTIFAGFTGGTRSVFLIYIASLLGSYLLACRHINIIRLMILIALFSIFSVAALYFQVQFRQIGLRNYLEGYREGAALIGDDSYLQVDYNIAAFAKMVHAFPDLYPHLGSEVIVWTIVRPIPRVLWPGKPTGLSVGLEQAAGVDGLTISVTCIGEFYIGFGVAGIVLGMLVLGGGCGMWNYLFRGQTGLMPSVVYASAFYPAAITMRSLFSLAPAMLITVGILVLMRLVDYQGRR